MCRVDIWEMRREPLRMQALDSEQRNENQWLQLPSPQLASVPHWFRGWQTRMPCSK